MHTTQLNDGKRVYTAAGFGDGHEKLILSFTNTGMKWQKQNAYRTMK